MDTLNNLVKADIPAVQVAAPWIRVDLDANRPFVVSLVRRRKMLVNLQGRGEFEVALRLPEDAVDTICVIVKLQLTGTDREQRVAEAFYDPTVSPSQKMKQFVEQSAREYVQKQGSAEHFLAEFEERHGRGLGDYLRTRIRTLTHLEVEPVVIETKQPAPTILCEYEALPLDLAGNSRGVPARLALNLDLDPANTALMATAYRNMEREDELQRLIPGWLATYFRGVALSALLDDMATVERNLRIALAEKAKLWGRVVGRLAVGRPQVDVRPVTGEFDCWLADGTNLRLTVGGSLWSHIAPGGADGADPWTRLSDVIQARASAILAPYSYEAFEREAPTLLARLIATVQEAATRSGALVSLQLRHEWSHAWLLPGVRISKTVQCGMPAGGTEWRLNVSMKCIMTTNGSRPWRQLTFAQTGKLLEELVDSTVADRLSLIGLKDYLDIETLTKSIRGALEEEVKNRLGLKIDSLQIQRTDDWQQQNLAPFLLEAPFLEISHPRLPSIKFQMQYKFMDTAVTSGTPFPVFPTSIEQMTASVVACVRDFLGELPNGQLYGLKRQDLLRKRVEREIPKRMEEKHFVRIAILTWTALATPELTRMEARLRELVKEINGTWNAGERQPLIEEAARLAPVVDELGGSVPWPELQVYGVIAMPVAETTAAGAPENDGVEIQGELDAPPMPGLSAPTGT